MPSPIGHALAGVAIAVGAGNRTPALRSLAWTCAVLSASADLDLLVPHAHRAYTHTVGAVLLIMIVVAGVTRWVMPARAMRWTLVCTAAYASHLVLDWMAADTFSPYGIRAFWPFSDGWYISGWDLFDQTARRDIFTRRVLLQNAHTIAREIAIVGPVVAAVVAGRFLLSRSHGRDALENPTIRPSNRR